jgi:hypothetical protein
MRTRLALPLILVAGLSAASASAWDLSVLAGFDFNHPAVNPDPANGGSYTSRGAFELGALGAFPLGESYRFETGFLRHSRDVTLNDSLADTETRYSGWLIPMTFRFVRADFLGFGFGPYLALLNQRTRTTVRYRSGGTAESDADDPNRRDYEVGVRANLRLSFPLFRSAKLVFDGSYLFGFTDLNKSETVESKSQDLLLLLGIQIPVGTPEIASAVEPTPVSAPAPIPAPTPTPAPTRK